MYLLGIEIQNIRSIKSFSWRIQPEQAAGWHVILGVNGSGKSSIMGMLAMTLVGPVESMAIRQDLNTWLTQGQPYGSCEIIITPERGFDKYAKSGKTVWKQELEAGISFTHFPSSGVLKRIPGRTNMSTKKKYRPEPDRHIWGTGKGWFSASFGPFRRFSGGNREYEKLFYQFPKLAPHLSIFGEDVALTESLTWLMSLNHRLLDYRSRGIDESETVDRFLTGIITFINDSEFLPNRVKLKQVTSDRVEFVDGNGCTLPVVDLSDGYRSVLSLTFELLRQLEICYGAEQLFDPNDPTRVRVPGVVLIDEIDVHLHPTWQQKIGRWFRRHFPKIQFIVTTHSTFVCQAAEVGTVWKLGAPGTDEGVRQVTGGELDRLIYGNILDAYSTGLFGSNNTRSPESEAKLRRLAELNLKSLEVDLTEMEKSEQDRLRKIFATEPNPGFAS
ncbi:MAG: AAA family ATPase [Acidobacteriota bacterium]|nr:AAA family ATPase [Acidobacteriota bacterium]